MALEIVYESQVELNVILQGRITELEQKTRKILGESSSKPKKTKSKTSKKESKKEDSEILEDPLG